MVYNQCLSSTLSRFPYLLCLSSHCYTTLLCRTSLFSSVHTCTQTHIHLKFVLHGKVESTPVFHLLNSCRQTNPSTLESRKYNLSYCPFLLSFGWPWTCVCSTSSQLHFWSVITISNTAVWGLWTGASNCRTREAIALWLHSILCCWVAATLQKIAPTLFSLFPHFPLSHFLIGANLCCWERSVCVILLSAKEKVFETGAEAAIGLMQISPSP